LPAAGQFYMLAAVDRWGGGADERPFLPRAFSVLRARGDMLQFLLEDVGPGTHRLGELRAGDDLWLAGPFGNGFARPREGLRAIRAGQSVPAQLALESGMACGFGACFGCVVPTKEGYVRLCVDGPVLDADTLELVA